VPQAALELKRTFRDALRVADSAVASEEQRQQLRMMVPIVLLSEVNLNPRANKRGRGKPFKRSSALAPPELALEEDDDDDEEEEEVVEEEAAEGEGEGEALPLDMLLLEAPLEGPLELEDFLESESGLLKNEERKCPYCPDRFHNGIGLANHVRGHLNRVGVSYNVRHFISAEEVKAIEQ
ncbi:WIZ protein, partial [Tricholaema leucomelas]|nr:WIZ protein [Tricholaema leucomelas]